jgi:8-oxo-dGTP pyrophosphatase MutT (NUDIX family)
MKQISAGGIVFRETPEGVKILLIKDRFGYCTWPKGHLESGEKLQDAAVREIREETGISGPDVMEEIGVQKYSFSSGDEHISKTVHIFLMEYTGNEALKAQLEEISSAEWFSPDEAMDKIGYENSRNILKRAIVIFSKKKG